MPDTVLEFDFKSTRQGEVQRIGLDNDNTLSPDKTFQLYGTEGFGIDDYRNYSGSAPGWKHYSIPVGKYFTGAMSFLTFVMDNDAGGPAPDSSFCNVRAYEKAPLGVGGDLGVNASDFQLTTFASGLAFPTGMSILSDGSMLVGTSQPKPGGSSYSSIGRLVRLVDGDGDGHADGPGTVLFDNLPGGITSVRLAGNLVFVTSAGSGSQAITVVRVGATPASKLSMMGSLDFSFPGDWEHQSYALAVRPTPGDSSNYTFPETRPSL